MQTASSWRSATPLRVEDRQPEPTKRERKGWEHPRRLDTEWAILIDRVGPCRSGRESPGSVRDAGPGDHRPADLVEGRGRDRREAHALAASRTRQRLLGWARKGCGASGSRG